jgi:hypothetical protein
MKIVESRLDNIEEKIKKSQAAFQSLPIQRTTA